MNGTKKLGWLLQVFFHKEELKEKVSDQVDRPEKCQLIHCGEACYKL